MKRALIFGLSLIIFTIFAGTYIHFYQISYGPEIQSACHVSAKEYIVSTHTTEYQRMGEMVVPVQVYVPPKWLVVISMAKHPNDWFVVDSEFLFRSHTWNLKGCRYSEIIQNGKRVGWDIIEVTL